MFLEPIGMILIVAIIQLINFVINPKQSNVLACGLAGFSGKDSFDFMKMKLLLYWNAMERGRDATGIFTPNSGTIKDNVEAKFYLDSERMSKIKPDKVLIGHVRAKTVGLNLQENSHPFEYGNIVMAHNGTLTNHWALVKQYDLKMVDYNVDSQVLADVISENFKETPNGSNIKVLSQYDGAAALLFYNKDQDILYTWHDKDRPLFYGFLDEGMYISSIKATLSVIGCTGITEFPVNTLHAIKDGKIIGTQVYERFISIATKSRENILTNAHTIKKVEHKGEWYNIIPEGYSGLTSTLATPELLAGYWLLCDSSRHNSGIERDSYYYCLGAVSATENWRLKVRDTKGNELEAYRSDFKVGDFIPIKGSYVTMMSTLTLKEDKSKKIAIKGNLFKVLSYSYGDNLIYLEEPYSGDRINCHVKYVRNSNKAEMSILEYNLREIEKYTKESNQQVIDFDNIVNNVINSNSEDGTKDVKDIEVTSNTIEFVDYGIYCDTLSAISSVVDDMTEKYNTNQDISLELDTLESMLINSYDVPTVDPTKENTPSCEC